LLAKIFGSISPKSKIKKVITTTSIKNPNNSLSAKLKVLLMKTEEKITIEIFTRLLAIRIVDRSSSLLLRKLSIIFSLSDAVLDSNNFKSVGESEKKATSEPEINAEKNSKITIIMSKIVFSAPKPTIKLEENNGTTESSSKT